MSPLAFLPAAFALPNGSDENHRPTLTRAPGKLTLDVNAAANDPTSDPEWKAADPDNHTVFYFFQLGKGVVVNDPEVFNLDGHPFNLDGKRLSAVSEDGRFRINPYTGEISRVDSDQELPELFCKDEDALNVVVTDTALVSLPVEVIIDRTIPDFIKENYDTEYSLAGLKNSYDTEAEPDPYLVADVGMEEGEYKITIDESITLGFKTESEVEDSPIVRQIDKLNFDIASPTITELNFYRQVVTQEQADACSDEVLHVGNNLEAEVTFSELAGDPAVDMYVTVVDQFGQDATKVEYIQFAEDAVFGSYLLNDGQNSESGYYHLTTNRDAESGNLIASECRDLLASDDGIGETLNGLGGNDLIFSHGNHDTLIGGAGNDLIVFDKEGNCSVVALGLAADAEKAFADYDTIANFFEGEHNQVQLELSGTNWAGDFATEEFLVDAQFVSNNLDNPDDFTEGFVLTAEGTGAVLQINWNNAIDFSEFSSMAVNFGDNAASSFYMIINDVSLPMFNESPVSLLLQVNNAADVNTLTGDEYKLMAVFDGGYANAFASQNIIFNPSPVLLV